MRKTLIWISFSCAALGLLGLGTLYVLGAAHPAPLFQLLAPLSLLLLFAALPFLAVSWILTICQEIRGKNYGIAALWVLFGLLLIVWELRRIL